jgi:hypothetical protein
MKVLHILWIILFQDPAGALLRVGVYISSVWLYTFWLKNNFWDINIGIINMHIAGNQVINKTYFTCVNRKTLFHLCEP